MHNQQLIFTFYSFLFLLSLIFWTVLRIEQERCDLNVGLLVRCSNSSSSVQVFHARNDNQLCFSEYCAQSCYFGGTIGWSIMECIINPIWKPFFIWVFHECVPPLTGGRNKFGWSQRSFSLDVYQLCWLHMRGHTALSATTDVFPIPRLPCRLCILRGIVWSGRDSAAEWMGGRGSSEVDQRD